MPGMNGPELLEKLEQLRPGLKGLFVSGYPSSTLRRHEPKLDKHRFLQKPFDLETLGQTLLELVDGSSK